MKTKALLVLVACAGLLAACGEDDSCTDEVVTTKVTALTAKIQEVGTKDPAKVAALMPKLQEIQAQATASTDPAARCKILDDFMAEVSK